MIKNISYSFLFTALALSLVSCAPAKSQSRSDKNKGEEYQEDISSYRLKYVDSSAIVEAPKPKLNVVPQNDISKSLNVKLDTLAKKNSSNKYTQGFRILVYSGRDSKEVQRVKAKVYEVLPEISTYPEFKSPNQRIKVGDCIDRVEAYSLLGKLKKHFPHAVIIPDNVIIKSR